MARPRPLFVTGNKRSGTTVLTDVLNAHPRVFVSHEADVGWILFQARDGLPPRFEPHPLDSRLLMSDTVRRGRRVLRETLGARRGREAVVEAFYRLEGEQVRRYMSRPLGQRFKRVAKIVGKRPTLARLRAALRPEPRARKDDLAWLGDKKHAQHLDPDVRSFLDAHLPDARYIHIVRHPRGVVASTKEAARTWREMPPYFRGSTAELLEMWARLEEWALLAAERAPDRVLTVRLEDLWADPTATTRRVLDFLGLEPTDGFVAAVRQAVNPRDPNAKYDSCALPHLPRAARLMALHGYK